jgi:cold shock CspA family protein
LCTSLHCSLFARQNLAGLAGRSTRHMPQATVKAYDSVTRTGKLVTDDGKTEYLVDPEAMESGMFRFLRPGQRVTFDLIEEGGEQKLRNLRIGLA